MGFACAVAAARAGHDVTLVAGPVALPDPPGLKTIRVESADDMYRAVMKAYAKAEAVVMTAAVGDYRPAKRFDGKLKKSGATLTLRLVRTRDILKIGFALEVKDAVHQAMLKYKKKKLDYIVLNAPKSFAADRMDCDVYREGAVVNPSAGRRRRTSPAG